MVGRLTPARSASSARVTSRSVAPASFPMETPGLSLVPSPPDHRHPDPPYASEYHQYAEVITAGQEIVSLGLLGRRATKKQLRFPVNIPIMRPRHVFGADT